MPSGSDTADVNEDNKPSKNVIAHISQFADDNLTIVRVSSISNQYMPSDFIVIVKKYDCPSIECIPQAMNACC